MIRIKASVICEEDRGGGIQESELCSGEVHICHSTADNWSDSDATHYERETWTIISFCRKKYPTKGIKVPTESIAAIERLAEFCLGKRSYDNKEDIKKLIWGVGDIVQSLKFFYMGRDCSNLQNDEVQLPPEVEELVQKFLATDGVERGRVTIDKDTPYCRDKGEPVIKIQVESWRKNQEG